MSQTAENELIIEIGTKVDFTDLDLLKKKIAELKEEGEVRASKLASNGVIPFPKQKDSDSAQASRATEDVVGLLKDIKVNSQEFVEVTKKEGEGLKNSIKKMGSEDRNKGASDSLMKNPIPSAGTAAGGTIGGVLGLLVGSPLIGAKIGAAFGELFSKVANKVSGNLEKVVPYLDNRISEDMHFRQLNYQTGMSVEKLYKLQKQAELAGTSLDTIIDSNQRFADELLGGLSQEKTQILMALNIDPRDLLLKSGGNLAATNQKVYESVNKAYKGQDPMIRTAMLRRLGYGDEEADSRRFIYQKDVKERAEKVYNVATKGGQNPFHTGAQLQSEILDFKGAQLEMGAAIRNAVTSGDIAKNIATNLMDVKAEIVNLIVQGANLAVKGGTFIKEEIDKHGLKAIETRKMNTPTTMSQKPMDQSRPGNSGKPASTSAISKVTGG
jgi:uncharacterized membrane protein